MREFQFKLNKFGGLRPKPTVDRNSGYFVNAINVKVTEDGLEPVIVAGSGGIAVVDICTWPFPQLHKWSQSTGNLLVGTNTKIYSVDAAGSLVELLAGLNGTGNMRTIADFGRHVILANNKQLAVRNGETGVWSIVSIPIEAVCNFRGQLIVGGSIGKPNFISWGNIGSIDINRQILMIADVPETSTAAIDYIRKNTAGYMIAPFNGTVYRLLELGPGLVAYGSNGIVGLVPINELAPGFAVIDIAKFGIAAKGAVGGDKQQHIFIDNVGRLWSLNAKFELNKLYYNEFILPSIASGLTIWFDEIEREYYVGCNFEDYPLAFNGLLTQKGLTQHSQLWTSLERLNGSLVGVGNMFSSTITDDIDITLHQLDIGLRNLKTLTSVALSGAFTSGQIGVKTRYDTASAFGSASYKPINKEGIGMVLKTAVEFQLLLNFEFSSSFELNELSIRYKVPDKRIRGAYVTDAKATTDSGSSLLATS